MQSHSAKSKKLGRGLSRDQPTCATHGPPTGEGSEGRPGNHKQQAGREPASALPLQQLGASEPSASGGRGLVS